MHFEPAIISVLLSRHPRSRMCEMEVIHLAWRLPTGSGNDNICPASIASLSSPPPTSIDSAVSLAFVAEDRLGFQSSPPALIYLGYHNS